jgi:hypothetical protein
MYMSTPSEHTEFPRRIINRATGIRRLALMAADEWYGEVRYARAYKAGINAPSDDPEAASRAARASFAGERYELPQASLCPGEGEQFWNSTVELYAVEACGNDHATANQKLRTLYQSYGELLEALLEAWKLSCLYDNGIPTGKWEELSRLLMEQCGWTADQVLEHIKRFHNMHCPKCGVQK